ncbi:MAG: 4-hydroxyphenylacetate 3-hydroxylase family protein [Candidatus Binataceae bacterium]
MRIGEEYIRGLRDGRAVYLDGDPVADVTTHPAFAAPIQRIAAVYDMARDPSRARNLTFVDEISGERISNMWLIPRTADDIRAHRRVHELWAEATYGLMGRTPDHVASIITMFGGSRDVFDRGGSRFGDNVVRFYERARREDLYLAYVIIPLQPDRTKPSHQQPIPFVQPTVVKERDDGIVLRGAHMIGTSAIMADGIFLSYIVPLQPGDEDHALSLYMPCDATGLRMYPRRPYAMGTNSVYDYPLSSRFDESDSLIVMHDVFVPWEHVFIYRNVDLVNAHMAESGSHVMANFQALARFTVKMRFAAGLARRLSELNNHISIPQTQSHLGGMIAAFVATFEALVAAAESNPAFRNGVARPSGQYVYSGMSLQRRLVVDIMRAIREIAGGAFHCVPSSERSFTSPHIGEDTRTLYGSVNATAEERVKVLKLIWDFVGTEFAGRQLQYEMFYSAAQHVVDARVFRSFHWDECARMVDACLAEYDLPR